MGLDQRLTWIGKISRDEKVLLQGREAYPDDGICLYHLGIEAIPKRDFDIKRYKHIKSLLTPVKMRVKETDWDSVRKDCNVSKKETLWGLGPHHVKFGETLEDSKEYRINLFSGKYDILVDRTLYLYRAIELYRWRNNYDIQDLFNNTYTDVYDEYHKKFEMEYGGFYPIDTLIEDMKRIDEKFEKEYCGIIQNVFYDSDW